LQMLAQPADDGVFANAVIVTHHHAASDDDMTFEYRAIAENDVLFDDDERPYLAVAADLRRRMYHCERMNTHGHVLVRWGGIGGGPWRFSEPPPPRRQRSLAPPTSAWLPRLGYRLARQYR
jgi:hypothetical protein